MPRATMRSLAAEGYPRFRLFLLGSYIALLSIAATPGGQRVGLSDPFILIYLALYGLQIRRLSGAWSSWFPALFAVMNLGLLVALVRTGIVTSYALIQKTVGLAFLMATFAVLADFMRTPARVRWVLSVYVKGVIVNVVLALAAYAVQKGDNAALPMINYLGVRLSGFALDPNAFGGMIGCALLLHLFTARTMQPLLSLEWRIAANVALPLGLVLTFSRSAWIGVIFGVGVALIASGRPARRAVMPLAVTIGLAVPVLAAVYLPDLARLAKRPDQVQGRVSIISDSLAEFAQSPLFGIGLGSFDVKHGLIIHNTLMWFLAELGLIGLVVFLGFVLSFAFRLLRLYRFGEPAVAALAVALLAAHFSMLGVSAGIEALYQRQWWLVFAAGAALGALLREQRR